MKQNKEADVRAALLPLEVDPAAAAGSAEIRFTAPQLLRLGSGDDSSPCGSSRPLQAAHVSETSSGTGTDWTLPAACAGPGLDSSSLDSSSKVAACPPATVPLIISGRTSANTELKRGSLKKPSPKRPISIPLTSAVLNEGCGYAISRLASCHGHPPWTSR